MDAVAPYKRLKVPTARQFRAMRETVALPQADFARRLQIGKRALQYYESGERRVPEWLTYRLIRMKLWTEG